MRAQQRLYRLAGKDDPPPSGASRSGRLRFAPDPLGVRTNFPATLST
jgi:hypothetical protein